MSELIYSKKSHRKIVHLPDCKIIQRVSEENRCSLENPEQARELGYRICKCCPPIGQKYIREHAEIKLFAEIPVSPAHFRIMRSILSQGMIAGRS